MKMNILNYNKGIPIKQYLSFFRMRFIAGLQYRAAAAAGVSTQFAWGILGLLLYRAFYQSNAEAFPISFQELASYLWLQQALLALFSAWIFENEIFQTVTDGSLAYELCRPADLYDMWFVRSMANRAAKTLLRSMPILIFAAFLPSPYGIGWPPDWTAFVGFVITSVLAFLVVVAFCMLVYIITFYTYSPAGVRLVAVSLVEFFSGAVIPLPFLPNKIRQIIELLPFASMQNVPLRVYSGDISEADIFIKAGLQLFWIVALVWLGRRMMTSALKRVVVQGG